ncbi:MAG: hypothetical protein HDT26_12805 [Subdoligranulum sp.]|nr:hypothetical protein [Subdoligranulum sp.]
MNTIFDFRKIPFRQDDASVLERAKIRELPGYERYCRDYGFFDEAAETFAQLYEKTNQMDIQQGGLTV